MTFSSSKLYLTFDQQCQRIEEYGITIDSTDSAISDLRRLGYYRLSAYWYPFRLPDLSDPNAPPLSQVYPGLSFSNIVVMCDFDDQLRSIVLKAVASVEIAVRVAVAYQLGRYGAMAYLTPATWSDHCLDTLTPNRPSAFEAFLIKHDEVLSRAQEDFVVHFAERYHGEVPVWAMIELWDFGTLSRAYRMLKPGDRTSVAAEFGVSHKVLGSWLVAINDLRNFCAHHARLSRRVFVNKPKIPRSNELHAFHHLPIAQPGDKLRLYPLLCVLAYLAARIDSTSSWQQDIVRHFSQLDDIKHLRLDHYGIPEDWTTTELWSSIPTSR